MVSLLSSGEKHNMMTKHDALREFFGHADFRPAQETLIDALMSSRDVMGVMPTGAGKSLCYQIPAVLLSGVSLVVSPLISLMKDQVTQLKAVGMPAAFINSSLTAAQYREVLRRAGDGRYKIIYIAPERLGVESFLSFAQETPIALVAIDEAHCVSQWGQDFRPSYLRISGFIESLSSRPVVGAFTATATSEVKNDILRLLGLKDALSITTGFDRPNLYFEVARPKNKAAHFVDLLAKYNGQCGIIYCATRRTVDTVCADLRKRGIATSRYHAGLDDEERRRNQEDFIQNRATVMVATNAFGMGIDKPDVRFVIHYNMPKNLESYYQEAGRAGRDGNPSDCIMLFSSDDIKIAEFLIRNSEKSEELTEKERQNAFRRDMQRLDKMTRYCESDICLRSYILRYFGETAMSKCGNCSNCIKTSRKRRLFSR